MTDTRGSEPEDKYDADDVESQVGNSGDREGKGIVAELEPGGVGVKLEERGGITCTVSDLWALEACRRWKSVDVKVDVEWVGVVGVDVHER